MPARQSIYKVNVTDVERQFALAAVTENTEQSVAISTFCDMFGIPLDDARIKAQTQELQVLKNLLTKNKK